MMSYLRDVWTTLSKPTGPRRERSRAVEEELAATREENISAVRRQRDAVRSLISDTLNLLEKSDDVGQRKKSA